MDICILGLSITSSWGNGHATTYRSLIKELARRGNKVTFLERDVPWYSQNRDLPCPPFCETHLYMNPEELRDRFASTVRAADLVILGSYVPDGITIGSWLRQTVGGVLAFYDIDTPVTLSRLQTNTCSYLAAENVRDYDLYLSFSGGPVLKTLERDYGSPMARPLYCSVDPELYSPEPAERHVDLGYMGTYSEDRQPPLEALLIEPAKRWAHGSFEVVGPQYPNSISWPSNVVRIDHLAPSEHRAFYNRQRFTLNITRADMIRSGFSPSVRLFEAAACATPTISDWWEGLDTFFEPDKEILVSRSPDETLRYLRELSPEAACELGRQARRKILNAHTAAHRAAELEKHFHEAWRETRKGSPRGRHRPKQQNDDGKDASNKSSKPALSDRAANRKSGSMVS